MDITAEDYIEINHIHVKHVMPLLDEIKKDIKDKNINITLDVGCGSGRITMLLHETIGFNKIMAIDIAQDMIDSAINNYSRDNVEYLLQDISVNWDQLRPEVKALEGKVSLVFSNQVIHWIKNKNQTIKNLYRLLSTGGKLYVCLAVVNPEFDELSSQEQQTINNLISVPSVQTQFDEWTNLLINNNLIISENKLFTFDCILSERLWQKAISKGLIKMLSLLTLDQKETQFNEFSNNNFDILLRGYDHIKTKFVDKNNGQLVSAKFLCIFSVSIK